jgi:autotransporter translocation and assembly factor TamB
MKVDNNLAQLYLNPDLKVTGTLSDPVVNGRISVTDGTVTFQNNTFTVTRGVIDFTNPYRTEAEIDFVSQTKVRNWNIFLSIKGPLNNLQISLSSIPLEQQSDIVSLLVMGKTVSELTKNQPGSGSSPALMAAELITSTYGSQIKRSTGLDILKMEYSSLSSPTQGSNYKFTVGKEISNRISISYEMETKNSQTTRRGIVSYKFLDDLLFNAYPGADGYYGAEFQIRHEFR